jgi:hypothetical protein
MSIPFAAALAQAVLSEEILFAKPACLQIAGSKKL